ncbi:hypothetical protein [Photobacterium sp.]|uniref:hypothetical protein n=1 Tax=Photobacterium sp. TaxID=660 RepID=UPI00299CF004|nr:hypothetical protein [Photobacterium sp.]MDX1303434.1 hypothetical protein [Photobacterium sp.]
MIKRNFYRIDEISDITSLTKSDLLDAVERQDLALCAWIEGKDFGLVSKTNALLGLFDYNGTVSLTKQQSQTLLCEGKSIRLEQFKIQEPERIKAIVDCRDRFAGLPNRTFSKLLYRSDVPTSLFVACGSVGEVSDQLASLNHIKEKQQKALEQGEKVKLFDDWMSLFVDAPVKQLGIQPIEIKPEQLRFDIRKLTEYFGIDCLKQPERLGVTNRTVNQKDSLSSQTVKPIKPNMETNPLKVVIHSILDVWPDLGSRQVWNALKEDVLTETRRFDDECVIDEMDSEQIIRFGVGTEAQVTTGFSRFKNLVSEVKKERKQKVSR